MNILLVCPYMPPENSIAAVRIGKLAAHLAARGDSVRVIAREPDADAIGQTPVDDPETDVRVLRTRDPMLAFRAGVRRRGVAAPALGTEGGTSRPESTRRRGRRRVLRRAEGIGRAIALTPDPFIYWARRAIKESDLGPWRPDVVVASGPPMSSFVVGRSLARKYGVPWVADFRDPLTSSAYYAYGPVRKAVDRAIERRLLRSAAALTTVSAPIADELAELHGKSPALVLNGFDPDDFAALEPVGTPGAELTVVYCGEIYPEKRDPTPLFKAMKLLARHGVLVSAHFYGATVSSLQELVDREVVGELVQIHGRVTHAESLAIQSAADVLLQLMWDDPGEVGVYTGKIFEYVGARRPILMLGYEQGVAAELVRDRGLGVVANDPVRLAAALEEWACQKATEGAVPAIPRGVQAGLTRQEQAAAMRHTLVGLVAGAS